MDTIKFAIANKLLTCWQHSQQHQSNYITEAIRWNSITNWQNTLAVVDYCSAVAFTATSTALMRQSGRREKKMSDRAGEKFVCIVFRVNFIIRTVWQRRFEVIQYTQQCSWILSQVARFTANGWIWRTRNILLANFKRYLDKKKRKNRNNNKIHMKRKRMTTASSTFLLINYFN